MNVTKSLHTGYNIRIEVNNRISEKLIVTKKMLLQGRSVSPIRFNLYLEDAIITWKVSADCGFKLNG